MSEFGTRVVNYCSDDVDVVAARHEANSARPSMSDFQLDAWLISAGWTIPTIGTGIWAYYEPAAQLTFLVYAAFQVWFIGRAVTGL